tara:strand:+ start:135 stop:644 length:510 start_codon:yes stop_codon:yes gene_type:complete
MFLIEQKDLDKYMPKVKGVSYENYHPDHIELFKGLDIHGVSLLSQQNRKQGVNYQSTIGPTITALHNNNPIAIFGCCILWAGVGEAWAVFDEKARRYPIAMTKGAFTFFDIVEILFSLHRLQITVVSKDKRAVAWAKYLGFISEGLMKQHSADKKDTFMMRRIIDGRHS